MMNQKNISMLKELFLEKVEEANEGIIYNMKVHKEAEDVLRTLEGELSEQEYANLKSKIDR